MQRTCIECGANRRRRCPLAAPSLTSRAVTALALKGSLGNDSTGEQFETLKQHTFWGREKENLIYPIALANLVLHGVDKPNLWHGNTLTGRESYGG
jgi:type I restriction-modification system DNA methylase subunit